MIELSHIDKEVGEEESKFKILKDVSLAIAEGEFVAIMGPSGSGKSTLMNIIGFLDVLTGGSYIFKGKDVSTLDPDELADYRSRDVGFVFQAFNLLPKTTVFDNVKMPLMYSRRKISEQEQNKICTKLIASVGLKQRQDAMSNRLSGGEKQRVAIARALVNDPSIIMADEPTGNLDSKSGAQIMKILADLHKAGKTLIVVTHDHAIAEHAHRIIRIKDGSIESDRKSK